MDRGGICFTGRSGDQERRDSFHDQAEPDERGAHHGGPRVGGQERGGRLGGGDWGASCSCSHNTCSRRLSSPPPLSSQPRHSSPTPTNPPTIHTTNTISTPYLFPAILSVCLSRRLTPTSICQQRGEGGGRYGGENKAWKKKPTTTPLRLCLGLPWLRACN